MLPPKFGNARYPTERRASLRYDASLVGMRYEKTVPAEPPIPIISRNPARPSRRPSSSSASSHSSFHSSYHRPVVVPPPGSIAPPTEEHPALRGTASSSPSPRTSPVSASEEWKRDSGVARANSTSTIHEEEDEDDFADSLCEQACGSIAVVPSSVSSLAASAVSRPSTTVRHMDDPFVDQNSITAPLESVSSAASSVVSNAGCTTPPPPPPASHSHPATPTRASRALPIPIPFSKSAKIPSSPSCPAPAATSSSYPPAPPPPSTSSSPRSSFSTSPRKFVKSLSLRSGQRLGKKSLSQMLSTPMQPLWRGSSTPVSSTSSDSSTPTGTTTSTAAAAPGTTASATANATATETAMAGPKQAPSWSPKGSSRFWHRSRSSTNSTTASAGTISSDCDLPFLPLDVSIPCDSLLDDGFMNSVTFSNRGSIMFGAQDIIALDGAVDQDNKSLDPSPATTKTAIDNDGRATPTTPTAPSLTSPTTPTRVATPMTPVSQSLPRPSDESNDMNKSDRRGSPQGQMSPPRHSRLGRRRGEGISKGEIALYCWRWFPR
ncbi:hypothetical protein NW754_006768 [Fusarium falciforme]|nr:hypothetical protein NW754_006768 [Fusarium falciforme]